VKLVHELLDTKNIPIHSAVEDVES